jgi:hypothetical protein
LLQRIGGSLDGISNTRGTKWFLEFPIPASDIYPAQSRNEGAPS